MIIQNYYYYIVYKKFFAFQYKFILLHIILLYIYTYKNNTYKIIHIKIQNIKKVTRNQNV